MKIKLWQAQIKARNFINFWQTNKTTTKSAYSLDLQFDTGISKKDFNICVYLWLYFLSPLICYLLILK